MLHEYFLSGLWPMGAWSILGLVAFAFLCLRFTIVWGNVLFSPKLQTKQDTDTPLVSILIPARNEAANIGQTLHYLQQQAYGQIEVIVLDDDSTDATASIVKEVALKDSRIRLMHGQALPNGWLGKNWACHQLSQQAKGDFFLFIDADVQVGARLLPTLLATRKQYGLQLLSVFPDQQLVSWGERIVVPIMHWILLSLLPLVWVRKFPFPSMAAANGQVMFFDAETYRQKHLHEKVKKEVVEDISIARLLKRERNKVGVFLGNRLVKCRMYEGYRHATEGFSKNLLMGFGNSIIALFCFLSLTTWAYIGLFFLPNGFSTIAFFLLIATNFGLAKLSNQPWYMLMLTHVPRMLALSQIAWQSVMRKLTKQNQWKGRNVHIG